MKTFKIFGWILLMAFSTIQFTACSDDDSNELKQEITLSENTQKQQTIFADNANAPKGISFEANGPWKAVIKEVSATRVENNGIEWLALSQYEGGAGEITINLIIKENNTGNDRKAEITIICGNSQITISIEQKATLENGNLPDGPIINKNKLVKKVTCTYSDYQEKSIYDFIYDDEGRIIKIISNEFDGETEKSEYSFTYLGNQVSFINHNEFHKENGGGKIILNDKGYAISGEFYCIYENKKSQHKSSWAYTPNGYLTQYVEDDYFTSNFIWKDKNLSQTPKGTLNYCTETFNYNTTIKNKANIDYNYLICVTTSYLSENLSMASGDGSGLTGILGSLGKRSENVISHIHIKHDPGETNCSLSYETDNDGYITKVYITKVYIHDENHSISGNTTVTIEYTK